MVMLITTSRNPTHHLRRMSKIIAFSIPNSQRLTRGSLSLNKIFRYCWNHQICRLLILEKNSEEHSILVKAYSIREKPRAIKARIVLKQKIFLQRHAKTQRIMVENVKLDFADNVGKEMRKQILDFFSPIIQDLGYDYSTKLLTINFEKIRSNSLIGHAVQQNSSKSLPLYSIYITSECNGNEKQI